MKRNGIGGGKRVVTKGSVSAFLVLGAAVAWVGLSQKAAQAQIPVGQAEGVKIRLLSLVSVDLASTNPLGISGATQNAGVASAFVLNTVSTDVITASTMGTPLNSVNMVTSTATVNNLDLFHGFSGSLLTADTVTSLTTASSSPTFASSGSTTITNLVFNGSSIGVTGAVNQTVDIGIARLVINEQSLVGSVRTTNALHLTVLSGVNAGDVVISHSEAGFGAPEPGAGTLALAFGPLLPACAAWQKRRRKRTVL